MIEKLEAMLAQNQEQDNALLRYSLGHAYLQQNQPEPAARHLRAALDFDPNYSAAWRALGQALTALDATEQALDAYRQGITVAEARGDKQAAKEMRVFLRRLEKQQR